MQDQTFLSRRGILRGCALTASLPLAAPFLATGLAARPARAAIDTPELTLPGWYRFAVGEIEATIMSDGPINIGSSEDHFPDADPEALEEVMEEAFLPVDPVIIEQNALIVQTGDRLVLIDTGTGALDTFGDGSGRLMDNLGAAGFDPASLTDIALTHAHPDHCFGLVAPDGTPHFPEAAVHISEAEFDFWTDEEKLGAGGMMAAMVGGARRNLLPLRDRIAFVEDGQEVAPGIQALATPGHTVGHTCFVITSGDESCLNIGDAAHHHAVSFRKPDWAFSFDTDPAEGARSRVRILDMLATDGMQVVGYHYPFPGIGHVRRADEGFHYVPKPLRHG
jgi:glyoxylase-like metal-dependent hydrolase (beta-lactamase superfamily II)